MGKKQSKKEYYGLESGNEVFGIEMHAWHVWTYLFHDTIEMKYYKNSFALSLSLSFLPFNTINPTTAVLLKFICH